MFCYLSLFQSEEDITTVRAPLLKENPATKKEGPDIIGGAVYLLRSVFVEASIGVPRQYSHCCNPRAKRGGYAGC